MFYVSSTSLIKSDLKLTNAAQTIRMSSKFFKEETGTVLLHVLPILNTFNLRMAHSTCIRTRAIYLVVFTSSAESWGLHIVNAGTLSLTRRGKRGSSIVNPRSAITSSSGSK